MQKHVNLVDLVKSFPTNIYLQNLASIQKRTSPVKFAHLAEKSGKGSISNLSTKVTTEGTLGVGAGWSGGLQLEASDDGTNWYRQAYQEGSNTVTSVCSRDVQPFGQEFYLQNKQYGVCKE